MGDRTVRLLDSFTDRCNPEELNTRIGDVAVIAKKRGITSEVSVNQKNATVRMKPVKKLNLNLRQASTA